MNPQKKMKLTILNNNTMKKIIFLIMISFISLKSMAGDGDKFFNISGGWQWKNTVNAVVGLEFEGKYHNAYELYIDLATAYDKCPVCNKVCSDSFWSYKTFGIGVAYKPTISRGKNSNLRWRFGADLGANRKGFQASIDIGLEYSYSFRNGMQVFVMQKNDFVFWTRDHFRNGLLVQSPNQKIPDRKTKCVIKILLSIIGVISSCTKHEDIIDTSLQPGSILCSDGSIVHPSLFSPSEKEAIGVVFWCNDGNNPNIKETAYAVSLEDLEENPLIDTDEDIANVSEDENSFDGAANTAAIMNFAIKDSLAYPAAQKAIEYAPKGVTGWFIGSIAQNKAISNNLEKVYSSFSIIGGTHFDGWYWSSTEDGAGKDTPKVFALISSLTKGRATSTSKRNSFKIRPIIAIR